jgi:hypothetical protein
MHINESFDKDEHWNCLKGSVHTSGNSGTLIAFRDMVFSQYLRHPRVLLRLVLTPNSLTSVGKRLDLH